MKIFGSIRKHSIVLTTLLVLIALGIIYLFIYLPHNEKIIREQRFHVLQEIDKSVHAKIDNSVALLDNLLTAFERYPRRSENVKFDSSTLEKYIKNISRNNFSIIPRTLILDTGRIIKDSLDKEYTLEINNKTQQIILHYTRPYSVPEGHIIGHKIGMKFSFDQFINFLLPQNVFDEYIIFSNGKTVYETFPAGISYVKGDSLMGL